MKKLIVLLTISLVMWIATTIIVEDTMKKIGTAVAEKETTSMTAVSDRKEEANETTAITDSEENATTSIITTSSTEEKEEKKQIFEKDLSVCKEYYLSVFKQSTRENIEGNDVECDCEGICTCIPLYHIIENNKEEDFYSAFFNGDNFFLPIEEIYIDNSYSMQQTFSYETLNIINNLTPFITEKEVQIKEVFECGKTDLYGFLSSLDNEIIFERKIVMPRKLPILITDLWDTEENEELFWLDGSMVFCVPYASSNKEGVLHCEEVVDNLLCNYAWTNNNFIYIIYTDDVIVEYSNCYRNGFEGYIEIYVP